jgi:hypothetical protein
LHNQLVFAFQLHSLNPHFSKEGFMKFTTLFALLAVLVFSTCVSAGIMSVNCYNDGDGAIEMTDWWTTDLANKPVEADVYMDEKLNWWPAHALVDVALDTQTDPTIRFTKDVDNDSDDGSTWTGYLINVVKNGDFSITSATQPAGWSTPVITAPVLQTSGIYAGRYLGSVSYDAGSGSPIPFGGSGVFKFTTSFVGDSNFCLEQIPTAVPEPAMFTLLLLGLAGLAIYKRR